MSQQVLYEMPLNSNLSISIFSALLVQKTSSHCFVSPLVCGNKIEQKQAYLDLLHQQRQSK